ncbi:YgfZ/GcvT domain-containing protein [Candidatus Pelagibacter communis]|uniref:CAF17-like 4Fe-4S cluster assembly/insertion protein YgfZ n=1 Tax=Pelagibacter ubique TaxID=198252 RepID=UPI00094C4F00|nr:folate-binding protein YgfZ [Candidatus Pelagibacter ubique]
MNIKDIYTLEDRGIIYINGPDTKKFLQNIFSNNIEKINDETTIFSSLLTPQGKYLFDFIITKHKNGYFLDCQKSQATELFNKLSLYKLRSKVEILNLSNEFVVAVLSQDKFLNLNNAIDKEGYTLKFREDPLFLDPRNKKLGARLIINLEKLYLSIKKLNLKPAEPKNYYKLSHELGIPQIECENLKDKIFGIECNFEELNGIDFKKGCYVGQENTARIKLKNKLSKRLLPFKVVKGKIEINEDIFFDNENVGKILIANNFPFGLIKMKNNNFDFLKNYKSKNATLKFLKPEWLID